MTQYTNNVHVTLNGNKTELFINFSLDSINNSNEKITIPVADLIMRSDFAEALANLILDLLHKDQKETAD